MLPCSTNMLLKHILALMCALTIASGCFIRNCPSGGKRTMEDFDTSHHRQCMSCADGRGQCVGPSICCVEKGGCHVGTSEADVCKKENESNTPCSVKGKSCDSSLFMGKCTADGICCNSESCVMDDNCRTAFSSKYSKEFLLFVKNLLESAKKDQH
ncbi:conopressin/neurophysin isoform X2 [Lingula anatina]|nr:conopressin/neurophysin isoform X2 [Lingula anatina]XP_013385740.1 conopressin/neurophysin isoform X2 [Lingula anatina]|eukprot:XP_013385738.1 conopressin/neurophysin isoform X2 [Lingula anatina]